MTNIGERIKAIRKSKGLTQQKFADELGLKRNTVGSYEISAGLPSDRTILDICQRFSINEDWLRTGNGEMRQPINRDKEIELFINDIMKKESDDFRRRFITVLSKLDSSEWQLLERMALKLAAEAKAERQTSKPVPQLHTIKIAGRDGTHIDRTITPEEADRLRAEMDAAPRVTDDDLL